MVRQFRKIKHGTPAKPQKEAQPAEHKEVVEPQPEEPETADAQPVEPQPEEKEERDEKPMGRFQVGQKVHFRPTHAKEMQLTGTIKQIDENNPSSLVVTAQPGGENAKAIEVERDFEASAEDATEAD